jgi:hypothetical protein
VREGDGQSNHEKAHGDTYAIEDQDGLACISWRLRALCRWVRLRLMRVKTLAAVWVTWLVTWLRRPRAATPALHWGLPIRSPFRRRWCPRIVWMHLSLVPVLCVFCAADPRCHSSSVEFEMCGRPPEVLIAKTFSLSLLENSGKTRI